MYLDYLKLAGAKLNQALVDSYFIPNFNSALQSAVNDAEVEVIKKLIDFRVRTIPEIDSRYQITWQNEAETFSVNIPVNMEVESLLEMIDLGCIPRDLTFYIRRLTELERFADVENIRSHLAAHDLYRLIDSIEDLESD